MQARGQSDQAEMLRLMSHNFIFWSFNQYLRISLNAKTALHYKSKEQKHQDLPKRLRCLPLLFDTKGPSLCRRSRPPASFHNSLQNPP